MSALSRWKSKWPGNTVFYTFDQSVSSITKAVIKAAIAIWQRSLHHCVKFAEGRSPLGYVKFQSRTEYCYSNYIGYPGPHILIVNLHFPSCLNYGTVLHEIGHTLGYWHEHSRPDRDSYVKIIKRNIEPKKVQQFRKMVVYVTTLGLSYDYDSIMHYSEKAFSKNGRRTIVVSNPQHYMKQGQPMLGQRNHLSKMDVLGIRRLYNCQE